MCIKMMIIIIVGAGKQSYFAKRCCLPYLLPAQPCILVGKIRHADNVCNLHLQSHSLLLNMPDLVDSSSIVQVLSQRLVNFSCTCYKSPTAMTIIMNEFSSRCMV